MGSLEAGGSDELSRRGRDVAAPRATRALSGLFVVLVLAQATLAGGFVGGHHAWLSWHKNLGDALVVVPLASLILGLACRRADSRLMLTSRVVLLLLVVVVVATGHAGGGLLALHIPAAVATVGLVTHQIVICNRAARPPRAPSPDPAS